MTEDEFRIIERKMAINRGEVQEEYVSSLSPNIEWPEHMIEAECTRLLEMDGWRSLRTDPVSDRGRGKGFGDLGMADHLYLDYNFGRVPLWVEYKSEKGHAKKHQIEWHTKERARGALTWIAGEDFPASVAGFVEHYRKTGLNRGRV